MSAFFGSLGAFRGTFGSTMNGQVQSDVFYAKSRKYNSALEASLDSANIPTSVYTRLVDGVNRNLPTFHRYLNLRKRMMGLVGAALLRSVCAARLVGRSQLHRRRGAEARARRARAARRRVRRGRDARVQRALDRHVSDAREALGRLLERRRVRRPSLHAAQLQRQVQRRQHARPRARPRDALATSRTRRSRSRWPAIPSSSPKSPRRSTRRSSTSTC